MLFVDAYDVLFTDSPQRLVKQLIKSGNKILISAEKGCCGHWVSVVESWLRTGGGAASSCRWWPVPEDGTAMPFLNSGMFAGFLPEMAALFTIMLSEYTSTLSIMQQRGFNTRILRGEDQPLLCHLYDGVQAEVDGGEGGVKRRIPLREHLGMGIDFHTQTFLCTWLVNVDNELSIKSGRLSYTGNSSCTHLAWRHRAPCERYMAQPNSPRSVPRLTHPMLVHFNGNSTFKALIWEIAPLLSFPHFGREELEAAVAWAPYSREGVQRPTVGDGHGRGHGGRRKAGRMLKAGRACARHRLAFVHSHPLGYD